MFALRLILAAGSFTTLISGAPLPVLSFPSLARPHAVIHTPSSLEERSSANTYTVHGGDGAPAAGWPTLSDWQTFDTMFANNQDVMSTGCAQFGVAENSADEIADIKSAITSVAASSGVDSRFILAVVMQESNGCVRAPTTNYGVVNPGLMQSHAGSGSCNGGSVLDPCPQSQITQMITDGVAGTTSGDGLLQCIAASGATDVSKYYKAARIYNSGSIDSSKNLGAGIATHCYSSDIANRLTGWYSGVSGCLPTTIAAFQGTLTSVTGDDSSVSSVASAPASTAAAGGIFVALPSSAPTPVSTPIAEAPVESPSPVASAASVIESAAPVESPSPVFSVTPVIESAVPVLPSSPITTSAPITSSVAPLSTFTASAASIASPESEATPSPSPSAASSVSTTSEAVTAGAACPVEGLWNCVGGSSFQQCASGTWSVVQSLAAGVKCTEGQSSAFDTSAIIV